ncbi:AAA family ATPase [Paenibacillus pasadenensis]|uniref:AAA family ATPase n=1 Tax=Paenibacillus pasadenensis TaxID=217090 RepID=UPI00203E0B60|nr:AAA family ATPase [Paenibacillus pasadenensis]MCM3749936.1 AAA family ATPase [Paenibacillus pasadenensis]
MSDNAKITLITDDSRLMQQLQQNLTFLNFTIGEQITKPREAYMELNHTEPRIIVLAEPLEPVSVPGIVQQLKKVNESAPVIYLSRTDDFAAIRELYRAGISDVLRVPDELEQLEAALQKAARFARAGRSSASGRGNRAQGGRILALFSASGGSGTTTAALHLAQMLAMKPGARVLLADLNMQYGGLQHYLDIQAERDLGDLKSVLQELTYSQLSNVLYKLEPSGVQVLLSPAHPQEAETFGGSDIELLFSACRQHFDYIVLDLPKSLDEISIAALNHADRVFYMLNVDRPSIVRMKHAFDIMDRYHLTDAEQLSILVNRHSKKADVTLDDLGKMVSVPVIGVIPEDNKMGIQSRMNVGKPLHVEPGMKIKRMRGPLKEYAELALKLFKEEGGEAHVDLPAVKQQSGRQISV